jgi:phage FluMu protein Com
MQKDIRCANCGRLLAKETDGVLHIKTGRNGEQILVESGKVHFVCPSYVYKESGKIICNETTKIEAPGAHTVMV